MPRPIEHLGHKIKRLTPEHHGRTGWRVERTGRDYPNLRAAQGAIETHLRSTMGALHRARRA